MGTYLSPGVYVEEVSGGTKPIAGVGTSTGAFVGFAEKGTAGKAKLITNWSQFRNEFGTFLPNSFLAYAVYSFFAEGGTSCYVVRVASDSSKSATVTIKDKGNADVLRATARSEGKWGERVTVTIEDASENKKDDGTAIDEKLFKLTVNYRDADTFKEEYEGGGITEIYDRVSLFDIAEKINDRSAFINVEVLAAIPTKPEDIKAFTTKPANNSYPLAGGDDGGIQDVDFIGDEVNKKGLHAFDEVDDINIVAVPDKFGDRDLILAGLNYCKNRKDCFFIADPPHTVAPSDPSKGGVKEFKNGTTDAFKGNAFNSSYGALYYPWVYISDPLTGKKKLVPPSGVVAGTYAYTDSARGVHKAPAGISEGYLDSVVGVERIVTKGENEVLNPIGINVIRSLPEGICIWGARTLAADPEWLYINVRRLLLYIEESIDKGSQWVVFEPNDPGLWGKVKRNITAFLTRVWRDGALFGSTPEDAFFVKVDEENNPQEVRDVGQLIIEVGVCPVKPAEFVIIRISQQCLKKK